MRMCYKRQFKTLYLDRKKDVFDFRPITVSAIGVIDKLESVYRNVRSGESMLTDFYLSMQRKDEKNGRVG